MGKTVEDMPTIDEPPTTEVGFALGGEVVGGRFRLGERLSWGGMGTVYRAVDLVTNREVAVKIPHLGDAKVDARFQAESVAIASVVCSSVIAYVAHGSTEEPFLAMELVSGDPLVSHLQQGALDVATTLTVGRRLASALAAIHLGGWVHRDIKPGNIVVAPDGAVKLLDFGLSREFQGSAGVATTQGELLGTLGYMAPEQLVPHRKPDPRSDVYSLGVVLYECITGKRAFRRSAADIVARKIDTKLDVRVLGLPARFTATLERAVSPDKRERPEDGLDMLLGLVGATEPLFVAPPREETGRAIIELLRMGAVHLTGEPNGALDGRMTARGIARVFAEIVAPSAVVRVRCDPYAATQPGAHADALAPLFAENAGRGLVVLLEDAQYCDTRSAERLASLAADRGIYLIVSTPFESDTTDPFAAIPRITRPWAEPTNTKELSPMARWCLRAAGMFGWGFSERGVRHLVDGPEAADVPEALEELYARNLISPERDRFVFASGRALAAARRLARPHEVRLGTRLARRADAPPPLSLERLVNVEAACARLAKSPSSS